MLILLLILIQQPLVKQKTRQIEGPLLSLREREETKEPCSECRRLRHIFGDDIPGFISKQFPKQQLLLCAAPGRSHREAAEPARTNPTGKKTSETLFSQYFSVLSGCPGTQSWKKKSEAVCCLPRSSCGCSRSAQSEDAQQHGQPEHVRMKEKQLRTLPWHCFSAKKV